MKAPHSSIAVLLLGSAVSAWIGWKWGSDASPSPQDEMAVIRMPTRITTNQIPVVAGDYDKVISSDWELRGRAAFAEVKLQILSAARHPSSLPDATAMGLVAELDANEAKLLLDDLLLLQPRPVEMIGAALARWAGTAAGPALDFARSKLNLTEYGEARGRILESWAKKDPKAAHAWYLEQIDFQPASLKWKLEQDFNNLIYQWGLRSPQEAVAACVGEENHTTFDGWYGVGHLVNVAGIREALFEAVGGIADAAKKKKAWGSVVGAWADANPREAAQWLETQPFAKDQDLQWRIAERWGRRVDPREAADFVIRNAEPTPESKDRALQMALPYWAMSDPQAAGDWLEGVGATDQSITTVANAWVRKDMSKAIDWVMRIPDERRRAALTDVMGAAKMASPNFNPGDWATRTGISAEELTQMAEQGNQSRMRRL